jgi:hypothetical protein
LPNPRHWSREGWRLDLFNLLKKLFFWNYARNTWQWDGLCVVILIFIFLTPKNWFENSERRASDAHQTQAISTVLISSELIDNAQDRSQVEQVVRTFTGRSDAQVLQIRKVPAKDGKVIGYEVDIH